LVGHALALAVAVGAVVLVAVGAVVLGRSDLFVV
jgi:hypothetical protein